MALSYGALWGRQWGDAFASSASGADGVGDQKRWMQSAISRTPPSARTIARLMTIGRERLSKAKTIAIAAIESGVELLLEAREILHLRERRALRHHLRRHDLASRVAASLRAIELPELVSSAVDYEELACSLYRDRARLTALRARLARNRVTAPLFRPPPGSGISADVGAVGERGSRRFVLGRVVRKSAA